MANYKQVSYGSTGSDVTELQKRLNQNGANLEVDGNFGPKVLEAVKDYQQKSGLTPDGIAGEKTWTALTTAPTGNGATDGASQTPTTPTFQYGDYQASDTVKQAEAMLQQQMAQKPGAYQSAWQTQLNDILQKILDREDFSYDMNADALYQQYKDQYTTQGKLAMMDTMGQAQAMTGGYGNSYAQSVGHQAYQQSLQQLNDKIPELYQLALSQHQAEGDDMYAQAALMAQMEDQDYGRHRDTVSDYYTELSRLTDDARYQSELDYSKWSDGRNFAYGQFSDDRSYEQWQAEFEEAKRQYDQQYELQQSASRKTGSGGGGGGGGDKRVIKYDALGYSSYNELTDALSEIASTQGNQALYSKLQHWVANGFIDSESATNIYTACAVNETPKPGNGPILTGNGGGYYHPRTGRTDMLN